MFVGERENKSLFSSFHINIIEEIIALWRGYTIQLSRHEESNENSDQMKSTFALLLPELFSNFVFSRVIYKLTLEFRSKIKELFVTHKIRQLI